MIKMIAGVFGLPIKNKNGVTIRVEGKGPNDEPFSTTPEREAELVKMGVARYVESPENANVAPGNDGTNAGAPTGSNERPAYSADMKADELRAIGKLFGLTFKVGMRKDEMVAQLDKLFAGSDNDESAANDGDGAPVFDAAEAVL